MSWQRLAGGWMRIGAEVNPRSKIRTWGAQIWGERKAEVAAATAAGLHCEGCYSSCAKHPPAMEGMSMISSPSSNGWVAAEEADVFLVDVDVDEAAELAVFILDVRGERGKIGVESGRKPSSFSASSSKDFGRRCGGRGRWAAQFLRSTGPPARATSPTSSPSTARMYSSKAASFGLIARSVAKRPSRASVVLRPLPVMQETVAGRARCGPASRGAR